MQGAVCGRQSIHCPVVGEDEKNVRSIYNTKALLAEFLNAYMDKYAVVDPAEMLAQLDAEFIINA